MTNTTKVLIAIGVLAIIGAYFFPRVGSPLGGAPVGATFGDAKIAAINMSPTVVGANATTSSILNTDSSDRKIENFFADCSGVGSSFVVNTGAGLTSAGWLVTYATTSTSVPTVVSNTNTVGMSLSTSTTDSYNAIGSATTTPSALFRVWPSGSYLTFQFNATNTAACVVGVNYLAS